MIEVFKRSLQITKLSFGVINKDKELLLFPLLAGLFSMAFIIAMIFPTVITAILEGTDVNYGTGLFYATLFLIYFGLAFIATFFNVCVVYTTKKRFEGGDATFMESLKFAFSKIYLIFLWSLVSASVGLLLRILENLASKLGKGGEVVARIVLGMLGMAWGIITIFVVPGLVYHNLTPFAAIKKSVSTLKSTWGESLVRYFGLGLMQFVAIVVGLFVFIPLIFLVSSLGSYFVLAFVILAIIYFVGVVLVFQVANSVYNTALFVYADKGEVPTGFGKEVLEHAFEHKN